MFVYRVNMYLGLKGGMVEIKYGSLYSTTFIESDTRLTEHQVAIEYFKKITSYPKTHYIEITEYKA